MVEEGVGSEGDVEGWKAALRLGREWRFPQGGKTQKVWVCTLLREGTPLEQRVGTGGPGANGTEGGTQNLLGYYTTSPNPNYRPM